MEKWEIALNKFLDKFKKEYNVIGALVCGSFVTGDPTEHSDIDIQLIAPDNSTYIERGNEIIDGFLIEYFYNPKKSILNFFELDYKTNRTVSYNMFLTGKILFDNNGKIKEIKKEAKKYFNKKFKKLDKSTLEAQKYSLWDMLDNIQCIYEQNSPDFVFSYNNALRELFEKYLKYLRLPVTHYYKFYSYLINAKSRAKYLQEEFPDKTFVKLMINAISETNKKEMLKHYEKITNYVLSKMGGFEIDGWKNRLKLKE